MNRLFRKLALFAAVIAGGFIATPVQASKPAAGVMIVDDAAGLFSREAVVKAKDTFHDTTFQSPTHYAVVTASRVPESKKSELDAIVKAKDKDGSNRFFANWARELARSKDSKGDVFTLIYKDASSTMFHVTTISDKESDVFRHFNDAKAGEVNKLYIEDLRKVKEGKLDGDEAKKEMDAALKSATQIVIDDLKDTAAPDKKTGRTNNNNKSNIMSYVCIGIVALLGIWLVVGLIRAFTGGGGGGGNGGGGYGGGGGGGGGGFMSGLMGGMLGGMAGAYLYNNMFGGGMHNDAMAGDSYNNGNNDSGNADTGDGDYSSGAEGGDGDFGDAGGGGGDAGGGGDWGGDAGGGGDFGGGGGDFGGGGGDW